MCKRRNESSQVSKEDYENQQTSFDNNMILYSGGVPPPPSFVMMNTNGGFNYDDPNGNQKPKRQFIRAIRRSGPSQVN